MLPDPLLFHFDTPRGWQAQDKKGKNFFLPFFSLFFFASQSRHKTTQIFFDIKEIIMHHRYVQSCKVFSHIYLDIHVSQMDFQGQITFFLKYVLVVSGMTVLSLVNHCETAFIVLNIKLLEYIPKPLHKYTRPEVCKIYNIPQHI